MNVYMTESHGRAMFVFRADSDAERLVFQRFVNECQREGWTIGIGSAGYRMDRAGCDSFNIVARETSKWHQRLKWWCKRKLARSAP